MSASSSDARRHDRLARFFELRRSRVTKTDHGDVEQTFFAFNRAGLEGLGVVPTERSTAKKYMKNTNCESLPKVFQKLSPRAQAMQATRGGHGDALHVLGQWG